MKALHKSQHMRARWPALGILLLSLVANPLSSATFTVSKTQDTNDGVCNADCSLREAVIAANALAGADRIELPGGTYRLSIQGTVEDHAAKGDLDISDDLTLAGEGAGISIVDANQIDRVLQVLGSATVRIEGVTLRNGDHHDEKYWLGGGGVLHTSSGDLTIVDSVVENNRASIGGGVSSIPGSGALTITDSAIRYNRTNGYNPSGGGIFNDGQALLVRVSIRGNSASYVDFLPGGMSEQYGEGGGITHRAGNLTLTDSALVHNTAGNDVGGLYIERPADSVVTLVNVTAAENRAGGIDGGWCSISADRIVNSTIAHSDGGVCDRDVQVRNSILAFNSGRISGYVRQNCAWETATIDGSYNISSDDSCDFTGPGNLHSTDPRLADLDYYGGATTTYALRDGSPAIDAADVSQCPSEDQRGVLRPQGAVCDIGALESRRPWKEDVVASFDIFGLFSRINDAAWLHIGNTNPDQVAVGDIDANGQHDVIGVFASGVFIKRNLGGWSHLTGRVPQTLAVGDLDGNGNDDLVFTFGSLGLWAWLNDARWRRLHTVSPEQVVVSDLDENAQDDVIGAFSSGIFARYNLGGWSQLHNTVPEQMVEGGEGYLGLVVDFGATGLFWWPGYHSGMRWIQLHNGDAELLTTGDIDGNGRPDVVASFARMEGVFVLPDPVRLPRPSWRQINNFTPDGIATADMDGNGQDDVIGDFSSTLTGLFVKRNDGPWEKLNNAGSSALAGGDLDGT